MTCISRWLKHWQALPLRNRIGSALCVAALVACVIALVLQIGALFDKAVPTADSAAVHSRVWDKTGPLLEQAVRHADLALDKHLASIHAFLDERKAGSIAFAELVVSLRGKWELVKAEIGDDSGYVAFLQEAFSERVFPTEELEKAENTAVRSYQRTAIAPKEP